MIKLWFLFYDFIYKLLEFFKLCYFCVLSPQASKKYLWSYTLPQTYIALCEARERMLTLQLSAWLLKLCFQILAFISKLQKMCNNMVVNISLYFLYNTTLTCLNMRLTYPYLVSRAYNTLYIFTVYDSIIFLPQSLANPVSLKLPLLPFLIFNVTSLPLFRSLSFPTLFPWPL